MHNHEEDLMLLCKHGAEVGGCVVIQHQTKETLAAILLAWTGEGSLSWGMQDVSDTS